MVERTRTTDANTVVARGKYDYLVTISRESMIMGFGGSGGSN
jgi:hypothetical protein